MLDNKIFYVLLLLGLLLILGGSFPKIAITIAFLIFLGAVLFNIDSFTEIINGRF